MASFSGFLTNYISGSLNQSNSDDTNYKDIISNAMIVLSQNQTISSSHVNDGFIFLGGLLIQFSASTSLTQLNQNNYIFNYPIPYELVNNIYSILLSDTTTNNNGPVGMLRSENNTNLSFNVRINSVAGNTMWVSIGRAPTIPMYKQITDNIISWTTVACSGDGKYVVGAGNGFTVKMSDKYGYGSGESYGSWIILPTVKLGISTALWDDVCINITGQYMIITGEGFYFYSKNYGIDWDRITFFRFKKLALNNNGTIAFAAANDPVNDIYNGVYKGSLNPFQDLSLLSGSPIANCVATDLTGQFVAIGTSTYIYTSTNSGQTWTQQTGSGSKSWLDIKSNSTGQYLVAIQSNQDYIYISNNYGVTWSAAAYSKYWLSIAINSSGKYIKAVTNGEGLYYSNNYGIGTNWSQLTSSSNITTTFAWRAIASDSTGSFCVMCATSTNPYISFNASA